ncbi:MAG: bacillithiol biosynthesis cysteine-adding enzyme BshC [Candidatus Sumerlaeaceae bacterium]|nr:bacillithiol biosynthesis cysteine-adding enzyme BshC [Candidatus Sumerlaeaceae bacterium]
MKSRDDTNSKCLEISYPENPTGLPHPLDDYPLVRDWLAGLDKALELTQPFPDTWAEIVERRTLHRPQPLTSEELRELADFNLAHGNVAGAALVPALGDPTTFVVVTGQQPNLLASPLFILVKAVATIELARSIAATTGRRVVPVFWVASDDHDFSELAQCYVLGRTGALRNLAVLVVRHGAFTEASPAYAWSLDPVREAIVAMLRSELPTGIARGETLDAVEKALATPATFESVFCRLLATYLEHNPIIFLAPRLRFMRDRQRSLLQRELEMPEQTNRAVEEGARMLSRRGYRPQVHRRLHDMNFFYLLDSVRCRLVRRGKRIALEHPGKKTILTTFPESDLAGHAERHWENFSPNVVMRPLVQDFVLPTLAYVAGPAEFTYLTQIRPVYELFGVQPALPVLRPMVTIISRGARSTLQRLEAWEVFVRSGLASVVEHIAMGDARLGNVLRRLREHEDNLQRELAQLGNNLTAQYPHLAVAFEKTRHHVANGLQKLRHRIMRQFRPSDDATCRDLCSVFTEIAPMATAQERVLSPLSFGYELTPSELVELLAQTLRGWVPKADPFVLALGERASLNNVRKSKITG